MVLTNYLCRCIVLYEVSNCWLFHLTLVVWTTSTSNKRLPSFQFKIFVFKAEITCQNALWGHLWAKLSEVTHNVATKTCSEPAPIPSMSLAPWENNLSYSGLLSLLIRLGATILVSFLVSEHQSRAKTSDAFAHARDMNCKENFDRSEAEALRSCIYQENACF